MVMKVVNALKPGTLFYEYFDGVVDEYVCLTAPARNDDGLWSWDARVSCGAGIPKVIDFAVHENYQFDGPRLSLNPEFE